MKTAAFVLASSASLVAAQVTFNNGTYTCAQPNVAYCAGDSLGTDIIIRCDATGKGQPGRCTDNLAGEPPLGVQPALCYQTSETAGDASCEKNCVVYGSSGSGNGTFTLPPEICTPYYTATSSGAPAPTNTTTPPPNSQSTLVTVTSTSNGTLPCPYCTGVTTVPTGNPTDNPTGNPTNTPVGPTKATGTTSSPTGVPTAGGSATKVSAALALVGFVAAALL